MQPLTTSI
jgi:hypothetical protein